MQIPTRTLLSGYEIPLFGLGTWRLAGAECQRMIEEAIAMGVRHFDTAVMYGNHREIGRAIRTTDRESLFITSKVPHSELTAAGVEHSVDQILSELQTDYLDLLLVHWPNREVPIGETLEAFRKLEEEGRVRSSGVSNFTLSHLDAALSSEVDILLVTNQVEFHPYLFQDDLLTAMDEEQMLLTAYSPLARGRVLTDPVILDISAELDSNPAAVTIAWLLQRSIAVIPKCSTLEHLKHNLEAISLELSDEQMEAIDSLNSYSRFVIPDWAEF